jgi:chromosome segregation protein
MRLKKLELLGFKSFTNPTIITFTEGITAVVGPNGCGKSNIVDAARWAMGEQSAKQLRGKSMEDVIFNGSQEMPPLGMAEVTLTFDNQDGTAPPEYASYSEIEVTRRLFRSGESEYLINRTSCRLKDITELFLGTGVGKQAYSVVEQGQIEYIISSKPEERRALIEEAAGISKYRSRKQEAERKMEATRQNLLRVRDIIAEIKRQMNSLNRQARKAERYKTYREELKEIELELYTLQSLELTRKLDRVQQEQKEKQERSEEILARIEFAEAQLEAQRAERMELEDRLRRAQERMFEIQSNIQGRENKLNYHEQEIESEKRLSARLKKETEELQLRVQALEAEIQRAEEEKSRLEQDAGNALERAGEAEAKRLELIQENQRMASGLETRRKRFFEIKQESASLQSNLNHLKSQEQELNQVFHEDLSRLKEMEEEGERFRKTSLEFNESLYQLRKFSDTIGSEYHATAQEIEGLRQNLAGTQARTEEVRGQCHRSFSRLESLIEMQARYEGFERGVKSIMEKKARDKKGLVENGIHGLVAEVMETLPEYETAVEAVLGERLQSVIVENQVQGLDAIRYLKEEAAGRGTFIPLEVRQAEAEPMPQELAAAGARPLLDLVNVKSDYRPVAQYLLGRVILVPSLDTAIKLWESNGFDQTMVTPDGAVLDPHGVLAGGSKDSYGILEKKREVRELTEEVKELKSRLDSVESETLSLQEKLKGKESDLERLRERGHRQEIEILNQEKELKASTHQSNQLDQKFKELKSRLKGTEAQIKENQGHIRSLEESIREKSRIENEVDAEILRESQEMETCKARLADAEAACTERKVESAAYKEKLFALANRHARLVQDLEEIKGGILSRERELAAGELELQNLYQVLEKTREEILSEIKARDEFESVLAGERHCYEKAQEALKQSEADLRELRQEEDSVRKDLNELKLNASELNLQTEHLSETVRDKYFIEPEQAITQYQERVNSQDYAADERKARRDEIRALLERMGEINLTAIEEYRELEERYSFLINQDADLIAALESLEKTIDKINRTYRREFRQTFNAVNEQFEKVFPRLFRGGKAMLVLTNEHDLLETGVEIIAQPPGKKLQIITLLSGGEKSLAAVALIIALFLHRPSPFCLLDEVDAALDDVNIDRFNELIQELSARSQFIIITHNKRTMQIANTLHGVTMEQPGVSKLISVKLN